MSFTLRACICALALAGTPAIAAESYTLDPSHTSVLYALNHLSFSTSRGIFRDVTGSTRPRREDTQREPPRGHDQDGEHRLLRR